MNVITGRSPRHGFSDCPYYDYDGYREYDFDGYRDCDYERYRHCDYDYNRYRNYDYEGYGDNYGYRDYDYSRYRGNKNHNYYSTFRNSNDKNKVWQTNNDIYCNNNQGRQTNNSGYGYPNDRYCRHHQGQRSLIPSQSYVDIHEKRVQGFDPRCGTLENVRSTTVRVVQPHGETVRYERSVNSDGVTRRVTMQRSAEVITDMRSPPVFVEKLSVNIKVSFTEPGSGRQREQKCVLQGVKTTFIQPKFFYPK